MSSDAKVSEVPAGGAAADVRLRGPRSYMDVPQLRREGGWKLRS